MSNAREVSWFVAGLQMIAQKILPEGFGRNVERTLQWDGALLKPALGDGKMSR